MPAQPLASGAAGWPMGEPDRAGGRMIGFSALSSLMANLPLLIALSAAVVVCLVLVVRRQDLASGLALGGFGGLLLTFMLTTLTPSAVYWLARARPARHVRLILGTFTLAESTMAALAVGCLIGALWLGLHKRTEH